MDVSKEPKSKSGISAADSKGKSTGISHVKCYNCGERGHIATTWAAIPPVEAIKESTRTCDRTISLTCTMSFKSVGTGLQYSVGWPSGEGQN